MTKKQGFLKAFTCLAIIIGMLTFASLDAAAGRKKLMVILDASGSMWGQIDGETKIDIARRVMTGIINDLPATVDVGLTAYGHRLKGDCNDVEILVPLGPVNKTALAQSLAALNPKGKTPMTASVQMVAEKLKSIEEETIILLISDGKETCAGDPCKLIKELKDSGIKFKLHIVGFDVTAEEKQQLECMAQSGGGMYFTAGNTASFKKAFQEIAAVNKVGAGLGKLSLSKTVFKPGESVSVSFEAPADYSTSAWVGIIPASVKHGSEVENDQHELAYQYLRNRTAGVMVFDAPMQTGKYDFRMHNTDSDGIETASTAFTVEGAADQGSLSLAKKTFRPGETIDLQFTAPARFKENAWIGIIPPDVPHGKEADGDAANLTYQHLSGKQQGILQFRAPLNQGTYDFRMYDTDSDGNESAYLTFTVAGQIEQGSLDCTPKVVKPGATLTVTFNATADCKDNAWVGIVPSNIPHGQEDLNDSNNKGYQYLSGKMSGTMTFTAPEEQGDYDFRLNDSDNNGAEIASVSFVVKN